VTWSERPLFDFVIGCRLIIVLRCVGLSPRIPSVFLCAMHNSFGDRSFGAAGHANLEQSATWPANTWHQLQTF